MNIALFLDRDGIICRMVKYKNGFDSPQKVGDVKLVKGIVEIIKLAKNKKWKVIEISNQPGVALGKQTPRISNAIEKKVQTLLKKANATLDAAYICLHHPQGVIPKLSINCDCRKPKAGLLLQASKDYDISLSQSYFYGDGATDVEASTVAGCKSIIFLHNENTPDKLRAARIAQANFKVKSHKEVYGILLSL